MKRKRLSLARQVLKCAFAKDLCREEDTKRSHNYRRHVKKTLSAKRRVLDKGIIEEEIAYLDCDED